MNQDIITLFNYHESTGLWYPSVISGVHLIASKAGNLTREGTTNSDAVNLIIPCTVEKTVQTSDGAKSYIGAKAYSVCDTPRFCFTFAPECDFIYDGAWHDLAPVADDDFDSGFYHEMNETLDGIYMISSAAFYGLLPHFEIGGG